MSKNNENKNIEAEFVPVPEEVPAENIPSEAPQSGKDLKILGMKVHVEKCSKEKKEKAKKEKKEKPSKKKLAAGIGAGVLIAAAGAGAVFATLAKRSTDQQDDLCLDDYPSEDEPEYAESGESESFENVPVETQETT